MSHGADSVKSIIFALCANLAIAISKLIAAAVTGSSAMMAEFVHSLAARKTSPFAGLSPGFWQGRLFLVVYCRFDIVQYGGSVFNLRRHPQIASR